MAANGMERVRQQREMMQDLSRLMRASVDNMSDPQGRALMETSAEVLGGLVRAFYHYESGDEEAWEREEEPATAN
ncbi:MAG: hypothetical protein ACM3S1_01270 [Hyphomicrobiales bacterium]